MCMRCKYEWGREGRTNSTSRVLVFGERIFTLLVETLDSVEKFLDLRLSPARSQVTNSKSNDDDQPGIPLLPLRTRP